jgi:hypothetical protein
MQFVYFNSCPAALSMQFERSVQAAVFLPRDVILYSTARRCITTLIPRYKYKTLAGDGCSEHTLGNSVLNAL